jgi:hypothetical protein
MDTAGGFLPRLRTVGTGTGTRGFVKPLYPHAINVQKTLTGEIQGNCRSGRRENPKMERVKRVRTSRPGTKMFLHAGRENGMARKHQAQAPEIRDLKAFNRHRDLLEAR